MLYVNAVNTTSDLGYGEVTEVARLLTTYRSQARREMPIEGSLMLGGDQGGDSIALKKGLKNGP